MLQQNNTTVQDLWNVIKVIPLSKENKEWLANKLRDNDSQTSGKEEDSFSQKIKQSTLISCRQGISKSNQL